MDERTRERLSERTRRVGAETAGARTPAREIGRFVGFRVQDTILGVPVSMVHEFAGLTHWVPLAGPGHVLGIAQLRGEVMSLVDLLEALTGRGSEIGDSIVVLQGRGGRVAAPVSEVLGARVVLESDLAPRRQLPPLCPAAPHSTSDFWWLVDGAALGAALDPESRPTDRESDAEAEPAAASRVD